MSLEFRQRVRRNLPIINWIDLEKLGLEWKSKDKVINFLSYIHKRIKKNWSIMSYDLHIIMARWVDFEN